MTANDLWFTARGAGLSALLTLSVATACGALGSLPTSAPGTGWWCSTCTGRPPRWASA